MNRRIAAAVAAIGAAATLTRSIDSPSALSSTGCQKSATTRGG